MAVNKSFLKYAASYSGIDGGDINAEYWFMGMEWSNIDDIKDHYDEEKNIWIEQTDFPDEEIDIEEKKEGKDVWKLEKKMDELYQKLKLKNKVSGKTIFQKNSNSLKLNLLPLPFVGTNEYDEWTQKKEHKYTQMTGCRYFDEYMREILPVRYKLFQKLLQEGKKPKIIFCFGTTYHKEFLFALTGKDDILKEPTIETQHTPIYVYDIKNSNIEKIIVCRFPTRYNFDDTDWQTICDLAEK